MKRRDIDVIKEFHKRECNEGVKFAPYLISMLVLICLGAYLLKHGISETVILDEGLVVIGSIMLGVGFTLYGVGLGNMKTEKQLLTEFEKVKA